MTELAYILSASHSGSTLLAMLVGSHPQAVTVGELAPGSLGNVTEYRCSCGTLLPECGFWKRVAERMAQRAGRFDLGDFRTHFQITSSPVTRRLLRPLYRGGPWEAFRDAALAICPSWRRELPGLRQNVQALAEAVAEVSGRRVVVDSSKRGVQLKYLLSTDGLNVKVIRLIRDGRAVALTYMDPWRFADARDPQLRGGGSGRRSGNGHRSMSEAAYEWKRSNEEAERLVSRLHPSQWTEVRYEALCSDPASTLGRIFEFLGLERISTVGSFRDVQHHVLGNGMRLDNERDVRLDDRWKSQLTPADLRAFETVAGPLNRRYGYA